MSEILISGYYGFANAGDEAMLAAMIEAFTDIDPNIKITVISGDPVDTRTRHGVNAVYRLNYPAIINKISTCDLLISGGGSLLQDVTSDRSLYYYLSIMLLAKKLGKPVMLYGQGIGPVRGSIAKGAMKYVGNMVDLITVRDEGSRRELERLEVNKPPIYVTADPVLAMHPVDKMIGRQILRRYGCEGAAPVIGISVREWRDWSHYKNVIAKTADQLIDKYKARIIFLPMQYPDDSLAAKKIVSRMLHKATVLDEDYSTYEMVSLVGNLDLLIGIRLHALIFAAVMHVPMVGISYDPKIDRFVETIGEKHAGTLQNITVDGLMGKVAAIWPLTDKPDDKWLERIEDLRKKAFCNAELAFELIAKTAKG